jgi:hypothetical protein
VTFPRVYIEIAIVRYIVKNAVRNLIVVQLVVFRPVPAPQIVKLLTMLFLTPFTIVKVQILRLFNSVKLLVYETWTLALRLSDLVFIYVSKPAISESRPQGFL